MLLNFPHRSYEALLRDDTEYARWNNMILFEQLYCDTIFSEDDPSCRAKNGFFHEMAKIIYELRDMFANKDTFHVVMEIREDLIQDVRWKCSKLGFVPTRTDHEEASA